MTWLVRLRRIAVARWQTLRVEMTRRRERRFQLRRLERIFG